MSHGDHSDDQHWLTIDGRAGHFGAFGYQDGREEDAKIEATKAKKEKKKKMVMMMHDDVEGINQNSRFLRLRPADTESR